jgi:hypothetical protein
MCLAPNHFVLCCVDLISCCADRQSIELILNSSSWDRIFIIKPPDCVGGITKDLIRWIHATYPNVESLSSSDATGLDDFVLLISAQNLVEDVSTYSFWAGLFSNATEKHVNLAFHGINSHDLSYVYHDTEAKKYYLKLIDGKLLQQSHLMFKKSFIGGQSNSLARNHKT